MAVKIVIHLYPGSN